MAKVFVKPRKARPFWFGHPWVFSGAIDRVRGQCQDGDIVELCDHEGHTIGQGFWNSKSQIHVRVVALAHEGELNESLLLSRIDRAIDLRRKQLQLDTKTTAYRVVHSEGDGLPGLIADKVGDYLVIQLSCLGLIPFVDKLVARLVERLSPRGVIERESKVAEEEEGLLRTPGLLSGEGPTGPVDIVEHGLRYRVDVLEGQKTGFYSDQRDNRHALAPLATGQEVLDAFSYVGAFALNMKRAGATSVHLLDSSEPALELAKQSAELNGLNEGLSFEKQNVLRALDHYKKEGRTFDVVVLDPPKFVHKRAGHEAGLRLYFEVNTKATRVLKDGGTLITCSCSQHVLDEHFEEMLATVAKESQLRFQEIYRGGQSADHPILIPLDESRYLKCRALRVWK